MAQIPAVYAAAPTLAARGLDSLRNREGRHESRGNDGRIGRVLRATVAVYHGRPWEVVSL